MHSLKEKCPAVFKPNFRLKTLHLNRLKCFVKLVKFTNYDGKSLKCACARNQMTRSTYSTVGYPQITYVKLLLFGQYKQTQMLYFA